MTINEYRALPKDERIKIQKKLLKLAPKASTDLEFSAEEKAVADKAKAEEEE